MFGLWNYCQRLNHIPDFSSKTSLYWPWSCVAKIDAKICIKVEIVLQPKTVCKRSQHVQKILEISILSVGIDCCIFLLERLYDVLFLYHISSVCCFLVCHLALNSFCCRSVWQLFTLFTRVLTVKCVVQIPKTPKVT